MAHEPRTKGLTRQYVVPADHRLGCLYTGTRKRRADAAGEGELENIEIGVRAVWFVQIRSDDGCHHVRGHTHGTL